MVGGGSRIRPCESAAGDKRRAEADVLAISGQIGAGSAYEGQLVWSPLDAVAEGGRILVGTADGQLAIYDAGSGALVKSWRRAVGRQAALLLGGVALCQAGLPSRERAGLECRRVEDEEHTIMDTPNINGGAPFSSALLAPMIAFIDGKYSHDSFFDTDKNSVTRGVNRHFDGSKIVATRSPDQLACGAVHDVWDRCKTPAPFALSTNGRYLAESRSGQVRIYRIAAH